MRDPGPEAYAGDSILVQPARRSSFAIGPEAIGIILAVTVVVTVIAGLQLGGPPAPPIVAVASPSSQASSAPGPTATTIDVFAITTCLDIDTRLFAARDGLVAALKAPKFDAPGVSTILRSANADLIVAIDVAARLKGHPDTAVVGGTLQAIYNETHAQIADIFDSSVRNEAAYHDGATNVVASLARLEPVDLVLRRIRAEAAASQPPSPTPRPSIAPPTAPPVSSGPAESGPPGSPAPSQPVGTGLVNPGFESGVGPPWQLLLAPGSTARLQADTAIHQGGAGAARVDISVAGEERAAVALRQGGLGIVAGGHYIGSIAVRTEATREVRIRIASEAGDSYATRLYTVGPAWQTITVDFTGFATDPTAYLEIDLGRSDTTTWFDDAAFVTVAATSG